VDRLYKTYTPDQMQAAIDDMKSGKVQSSPGTWPVSMLTCPGGQTSVGMVMDAPVGSGEII
jgi:hypothetical protein